MSKLLYLESSPRKDRSASTEVAQSFIATFRDADAKNDVETIDLWDFQLPEFDGDRINAKYRMLHGENQTNEEIRAWDEISKIVARFKDADSYLFSIPGIVIFISNSLRVSIKLYRFSPARAGS